VVAAPVGFGDEGAELALTAFEVTVFEGMKRILYLFGHGLRVGRASVGLVCMLECEGEESSAGLIGRSVEWVGWRGGIGEGFEERCGWEAVVPVGVLDELLGGEGACGVVLGKDEGVEEDALGFAGGVLRVRADAFDALGRSLFELLTKSGGVDAEFLRGVGGELVALNAVRHAADVREEEVKGFDLRVGSTAGEEVTSAINEVVGVALGGAQGGHIGLDALVADEAVGVEAAFEGDDFDFEVFFGEEGDGFFCGIGTGSVGVEVDDDALGESAEKADLCLGECCARGGEDVLYTGHVHGDAVHLTFDEEGEVVSAHAGLGFVEVEEDLAFCVERGLGGVEILCDVAALFVLCVEGTCGEGDGLALLVGDWEGDAFAKAGVELALGAVGLLLRTEEAAGAKDLVGEVFGELFAHVVEVVGCVADAELCDGVGVDAAAGEVFAGACSFGGFETGFEVLGGDLVDVDELAAKAGFAGFFRRAELALRQRDSALGGDDADCLREADVLHLHDEGEDVAFLVAAEAVEVVVRCVDREGAGLFFVKGAEAGVVLRAGFAQLDVVADDADDVGLLLDGLCEVVGHACGAGVSVAVQMRFLGIEFPPVFKFRRRKKLVVNGSGVWRVYSIFEGCFGKSGVLMVVFCW